MESFEKTIDYINKNYPNHFIIADAKRGDIGNTSGRYAKAFLKTMGLMPLQFHLIWVGTR